MGRGFHCFVTGSHCPNAGLRAGEVPAGSVPLGTDCLVKARPAPERENPQSGRGGAKWLGDSVTS